MRPEEGIKKLSKGGLRVALPNNFFPRQGPLLKWQFQGKLALLLYLYKFKVRWRAIETKLGDEQKVQVITILAVIFRG